MRTWLEWLIIASFLKGLPNRHRSPLARLVNATGEGSGQLGPATPRRMRPDTGLTRTPPPASSNTAARGWPWSKQEIRWRQCRGCACYTYHRDARPNLLTLSESLAGTASRTSMPSLFSKSPASGAIPDRRRSKLRPWNDSLQMHEPGKCPRSPGPSPL